MEKIIRLKDLFIQQMRIRLNALEQQTKFVEKITKHTKSSQLKLILTKDISLNKKHIKCIKQILKVLEQKAKGEVCEGIKNLISEAIELINRSFDNKITFDAVLIVSLQNINHYTIAGYINCKMFAKALGHDEISDVLDEMQSEKKNLVRRLSDFTLFHVYKPELNSLEEI